MANDRARPADATPQPARPTEQVQCPECSAELNALADDPDFDGKSGDLGECHHTAEQIAAMRTARSAAPLVSSPSAETVSEQEHLGSTEKALPAVANQQQEPEPSREATGASGGIMCGDDGCVSISAADASALYDAAKQQQAARVERYPDETSAIRAMCDGWVRLKEMGWREAMYAPKGAPLELIEVGSSGIHRGYRDELGFWVVDGDTWPSSACLWRMGTP